MLSTTIFLIVELIELTIAVIHVNIIYREVYRDMVCCNIYDNG
jgi:hypothetical protein